ncbi:MAG: hypothetical protein ACTSSG_07185 [Candidatus Heimdallarchaeaceae archaeon]
MEERYESKRYKRIELSGFLIAMIGNLLLLIGFCVPCLLYPKKEGHPGYFLLLSVSYNYQEDVYFKFLDVVALFIFIFIVCMFILSSIALIGFHNSKLSKVANPTSILLIYSIFMFFPSFDRSYLPMIFCITETLTSVGSSVAYGTMRKSYEYFTQFGVGFYLLAIGLVLFLTSYPILIFSAWNKMNNNKLRQKKPKKSNLLIESNKSVFEVIISSFGIFACVGIIVGLLVPYFYWVFKFTPSDFPKESYLLDSVSYHDNFAYYVRFNTIYYLVLIISLLLFFILNLISYSKTNYKKNYKPVLSFLLIVFLLVPSSTPISIYSYGNNYFTLGVFSFLIFIYIQIYVAANSRIDYNQGISDSKFVISPTVWILVISLIILSLVLLFYFVNYITKKINNKNKKTNS